MPTRTSRIVVTGLIALAPFAGRSQDVVDLAGVRPGDTLAAVTNSRSVAESPNPFVFFGIPTRLPALAAIFPAVRRTY